MQHDIAGRGFRLLTKRVRSEKSDWGLRLPFLTELHQVVYPGMFKILRKGVFARAISPLK
jgi:hypothetical protein